jgi:hypothetical protein
MTEVTLYNMSVPECLEIVATLRTYLDQAQDFTYAYYQAKYDYLSMEHTPSSVIFRFADPAVATMFALRYVT